MSHPMQSGPGTQLHTVIQGSKLLPFCALPYLTCGRQGHLGIFQVANENREHGEEDPGFWRSGLEVVCVPSAHIALAMI